MIDYLIIFAFDKKSDSMTRNTENRYTGNVPAITDGTMVPTVGTFGSYKAGVLLVFMVAVYVQCSHPASHSATEANENKKVGEYISVTCDQAEELTVKLSDLADSLEYVPLETTENSLIKYVNQLTVMKQHILVNDGCGYLLFSRQGKFICRVGSRGNGPGEFICGNCYDIDEENERIYIWGVYEKHLYVMIFTVNFWKIFTLKIFRE